MEQAVSLTEGDIRSTPEILAGTIARVEQCRGTLAPMLTGPLVLLGCGSSHCVALAGADLYEAHGHGPAQAVFPSDYVPRPDWLHLAISRTGQTTELVGAMRAGEGGGSARHPAGRGAGLPGGPPLPTCVCRSLLPL